ncbi:podocan-like protein 1 [Gouania willdenowi]|uniref:podocan-like protein 1 n=1 Tax=Gouania willdenowi TaxID=441366 RepID=UPI001056B1AD|nr:podocan-like protein 1 [Gouania willdenowi]
MKMLMFPFFFAAFGFSDVLQLGAFSAPVWKESSTATIQLITQTPHPPPPPLLHVDNGSCFVLITSSLKHPGASHVPTPKPQAGAQLSSLKIPSSSTFNHIPDLGKKLPRHHRIKEKDVLSLKDRQTPNKGNIGNSRFTFSELKATPKPKSTITQTIEVQKNPNPSPKYQQIKFTEKQAKHAHKSNVPPIRNEPISTLKQDKASSPHLHHTATKTSSKKQHGGKMRKKKKKKKQNYRKLQPPQPASLTDNHCPSECVCFGSVVECSDRGVYKVPHGIPNNSSFISLKNNFISSIRMDLLHHLTSLQFLILSNNWLTDNSLRGVFKEGILALKHLYLDNNHLETVPVDLPRSLEELHLDNNYLRDLLEDSWLQCPFLSILSLSNNQLGHGSQSFPDGVLSPLFNLRTLNLSHNQLTSVPMGLPPSIIELYLKGNLIKQLHERTFIGMTKLEVLDFSGNKLTNDGLGNSLNVTHLESLNLEANQLEQVPQTLPSSLKVLNLGSNLISSIKKVAFSNLKKLELLSVARNKVFEVAAGAFRALSFLHQLDFSHNTLQKVPRLLPRNVHSVSLSNNRIRSVPADAFCWGNQTLTIGRRVHVELENNLIDSGTLDPKVFRCIHENLVVHF